MTKSRALIFVFVVGGLFIQCSMNMAGATSETTNGKIVTGIVQSENGMPVKHAAIFIRTVDFLKDTSQIDSVAKPDGYTDEKGQFSIDSLSPGDYEILITSDSGEALRVKATKAPDAALDIKTVRLKRVAGIYGIVNRNNIPVTERIYVQIYGLDMIRLIDSSGGFYFSNLPADTLLLRISSNNPYVGVIDYDTVVVDVAQTNDVGTYLMPFETWRDTVVVREILDINGLFATPVSQKVRLGPQGRVAELNCMNSAIKKLPGSIGALRLRYLRLQQNLLDSLPEEIGNILTLGHIVLQRNQLTRLPQSIGNLVNLRHLDISGNRLTELPNSITNLKQIEFLTVANNRLHNVPPPIMIWLDMYSREKNWRDLQLP